MGHSDAAPVSIKQVYGDCEVEYVRKDTVSNVTKDPKHGYYPVGKQVLIRTVTMIDVGILVDVTDHDLILQKASWVADTGRWSDCLSGKVMANEIEPFPADKIVGVNRGAIIDWVEYNGDVSKQK